LKNLNKNEDIEEKIEKSLIVLFFLIFASIGYILMHFLHF